MPRAQKRQIVAAAEVVLASPAMRKLDQLLRKVAPKDVTLTFVGESGSGKEVLARRAHELSERRQGPFIPINCAAIPEALFESELFGHERGAFTGANARAIGKVEAAETGTLFLDEIAELPLGLQAKLLRFLESRRFMRVGGSSKLQADVRLIVATLRPLDEEMRAGRFRSDLYYRLQGILLEVPPLRQRRADLAPLLRHLLDATSARHQLPAPRLTRQTRALLMAHDWPGNVRELKNVVESLCLLRAGLKARPRDLPPALRRPAPSRPARPSRQLRLALDRPLEALMATVVEAVLSDEDGNRGRAAERLGISVRTVQRLIASGRVRGAV